MRQYYCILLLGLFPLFTVFAQNNHTPIPTAEEMPYFTGCQHLPQGSPQKRQCANEQLLAFINQHLRYPNEAKARGIEGTVYVSFTVDASGRVLNPEIISGIGGGCDKEALRVVAQMPRWEPARKGTRAVPVTLHLPIRFSLKDQDKIVESLTLTWGTLTNTEVTRAQLLEHLDQPIFVRDAQGNVLPIEELVFVLTRKGQRRVAQSDGRITPQMRKLVQRLRPGHIFTLVVAVQYKGHFYYINRPYHIIATP